MRRVIGAVGRSLVTLGALILLFVTYQLWGTGLYTSREQDRLRDELTSELRRPDREAPRTTTSTSTTTTTTTAPSTTTTTVAAPAPRAPVAREGEAIALIRIPRIEVNDVVVEGVNRADLRKGPGHYPDTPFPGQEGNAAIAGHRTTYGAPFGDLELLEEDDRIRVRTVQGDFTYEVYESLIVEPGDVEVLDPDRTRTATLTLTTCHPRYSAAQRLVVKAELREEALPASDGTDDANLTAAGLSGEESSKLPTVVTGLVAALIGGLWWLLFHRHPSLFNWLLGVVPFAAALLVFYAFLERVLPANY